MVEWWVVDRHGNRYGPMSDEDARDYVAMWDRDTPDDAPHHVETPRKVRVKKTARVRPVAKDKERP